MKMQLSALPDYDEFRTLFTQYKITSWKTTITPTFKDNQPCVAQHDPTGATWAQINPTIPNMENNVHHPSHIQCPHWNPRLG